MIAIILYQVVIYHLLSYFVGVIFLLYCFVLQLLDTGFFHADPHPGNMIRTPDGKLAILDFGNDSSSNYYHLSKKCIWFHSYIHRRLREAFC